MRWTTWALVALLSAGCSGGGKPLDDDTGATGGADGSDGGDDGSGGGPATFDDFINTTTTPSGDFGDFADGYDAVGDWLPVGSPGAGCETTVALDSLVEDFEKETGVPEATVEIWYADVVDGAPDSTVVSNSEGDVTGGEVPTCSPITYRTTTDPALDDTRPTFEAHQVFAYTTSGATEPFNSVAKSTYQLIPSLLGVSVDPTRGVAAGTVYDINGDPVTGAQVVVTDASGSLASDTVVRYFIERFPNRDQPDTSEDGLWIAINIPPGDWNVDAYVADGSGGHKLMGRTTITVFADSINIGNVYVGYTGVKLPDACLADCG